MEQPGGGTCCHRQQHRNVVAVCVCNVEQRTEGVLHGRLLPCCHPCVALKNFESNGARGLAADLGGMRGAGRASKSEQGKPSPLAWHGKRSGAAGA